MKIYIDGNFYDKENAKISVFDHGLLYGDGIFEGIRIYNKKIFKLKEHIDRLYMSAKAILLEMPLSKQELEAALYKTVELNKKVNGYIRLVVTRGTGDLGINPYLCKKASVIIIADDIVLYPEKFYKEGISIISSSIKRLPPNIFDVRIKSLNYLSNVLAKIEAIQANCLEAVMLNSEGYISECTGDNIFIIKKDSLLTVGANQCILEGITRNTVMEIAKKLGFKVFETQLTQYDLYNADECFLSGTSAEIISVIKIDGRTIGTGKPGEKTLKLLNEFKNETLR